MRPSEETLLAVAKTTLAHALTHLADLAVYGLTEVQLAQFRANIDTAEAMRSETDQRIALRQLTADKDAALDACVLWGRQLRTRFQQVFHRNAEPGNHENRFNPSLCQKT